jgi:putative restriction endonuclease
MTPATLRFMPKTPTVKWTRAHALIALNLYGKLPFGKFDKSNRVIIDVASRMGRSSSSLAMKLSNLASLDPIQQARGIKGLSGASKQDRDLWKEFHARISDLGPESEQLLHDLFTKDDNREVDFLERDKVRIEPSLKPPAGPTETTASVRVRRGQQFFRQTILNSYGVRCCISGINVPRLLVASHIKPWRDFPRERLDPRNRLCLSSLHDAAFDAGLIALDENFGVVLSTKLKRFFPSCALEHNFAQFEGQSIRLPDKLTEPDPSFLRFHRKKIFRG